MTTLPAISIICHQEWDPGCGEIHVEIQAVYRSDETAERITEEMNKNSGQDIDMLRRMKIGLPYYIERFIIMDEA
jgi:hypothetical protein